MEKKFYIQPALKATEMDEELLAAVSDPVIDENEPSVDLARQHGVWDTPEEINGKTTKGVWDE
ncbi:MAG: hypothetical protein IJM78_07810 [Prevotella sp.]|nr:hypothetical protein [Prevotella sp.]